MAADVLVPKEVLIHEKLYPVFAVVHQPHDTHRTRVKPQVFNHLFGRRKTEARGANLRREFFGLKGLVPRHHQEIKSGLLPVTEK